MLHKNPSQISLRGIFRIECDKKGGVSDARGGYARGGERKPHFKNRFTEEYRFTAFYLLNTTSN